MHLDEMSTVISIQQAQLDEAKAVLGEQGVMNREMHAVGGHGQSGALLPHIAVLLSKVADRLPAIDSSASASALPGTMADLFDLVQQLRQMTHSCRNADALVTENGRLVQQVQELYRQIRHLQDQNAHLHENLRVACAAKERQRETKSTPRDAQVVKDDVQVPLRTPLANIVPRGVFLISPSTGEIPSPIPALPLSHSPWVTT